MKKSLLFVLAVVLVLVVSPAYALFTNGGFDTGDASGWTVVGDYSVISSFSPQFNNTSGWTSGIPYYGSHSLMLGSGDVGNVWDDRHQSSATQTDTVSAADIAAGLHLYFKWGAILEEPTNNATHTDAQQPYFSVDISKWNGGGWTSMYYDDHRANQLGFTKIGTNALGDDGDIWYGSAVTDFDLSSLTAGDQVKIDLFVRDCGQGGHGGLVFLDGFGTEQPPDDNVVPEPGTLMLLGTGLVGLIGLRRKSR